MLWSVCEIWKYVCTFQREALMTFGSHRHWPVGLDRWVPARSFDANVHKMGTRAANVGSFALKPVGKIYAKYDAADSQAEKQQKTIRIS